MKKISILIVLFLLFNKAIAVETQVEFGPFINCIVFNDEDYDIKIKRTKYKVNGLQGPAQSNFVCRSNCYVPSYGSIKMSGPNNHPAITGASCKVYYDRID